MSSKGIPREHVFLKRTDEQVQFVEAVPPTWRDTWAIVRGRYQPLVRVVTVHNTKWANRMLKERYLEPVATTLRQRSGFLGALRRNNKESGQEDREVRESTDE